MTNPDARAWDALDLEKPPFVAQQEAVAQFKVAHPAITFARMTLLGMERLAQPGQQHDQLFRQAPWLCIEGWLTPPDDQGPEPTDADIPTGFA